MRAVIVVDTIAVLINAFLVARGLWPDHAINIINLVVAIGVAAFGAWIVSGWRQRDKHEARINQLTNDIVRLEQRMGVNG
jgi:hypothetical protein